MVLREGSKPRLPSLLGLLLAASLGGNAQAQDPPPAPGTPPEAAADAPAAARPEDPKKTDPSEPKPYAKVITADAKTQKGLFTVHRVKSKLYFEIPKELLDQPLLMVANATAVPVGFDHVGKALNQQIVRFTRNGNRIFLQGIDQRYTTDQDEPNADAVAASQRDAILLALNVEAFAPDGAPVVEVSRLFTSEVGAFSARAELKAMSMDTSRSYVNTSHAFPGSVRVDAVHTYMSPAMVNSPMGAQKAPAHFPAQPESLDIAYNIVKLPEKPMMPRLMDDRVGYFYVNRLNFGGEASPAKDERLIARWRLEKKDPGAALSEPVKPIVWYIDKSTPTAMVPYVKRGIEAWNTAFEAAGFRNAVQARPFPTKAEDPEFDPEDVRYSIIRWVPSKVNNAYGPSLKDPRTGEILNANIVMYHNVQQMLRNWYIAQAGAVDPRARQLPLPDDLMGDLVAMVVTNEVGHSLGFQHNMKASSMYPVEKLRDPKWLQTMGHTPSIMDYARMNYLVQPGDEIDPALLLPRIGPYDLFAVRWGYAPIPGAKTPDDEKPVLDQWAREQDDKPWLRFSSPKQGGGDYGDQMEAVGDADAVTATDLGIRNLKRIMKQLPRIAMRSGENDKDLEDLYRTLNSQWQTELGHVASIVGGYDFHNKHGGQPGPVYRAASKAQQARAVAFLNEQVFKTPEWVLDPAVQQRLTPGITRLAVVGAQRRVLGELLESRRLNFMQAQEQEAGSDAYSVLQLLSDLRAGVFAELAGRDTPTLLRRDLQRAYIEAVSKKIDGNGGGDDNRSTLRAEMKHLHELFVAAARDSNDPTARAHWDAMADMADQALYPTATGTPARRPPAPEMSFESIGMDPEMLY